MLDSSNTATINNNLVRRFCTESWHVNVEHQLVYTNCCNHHQCSLSHCKDWETMKIVDMKKTYSDAKVATMVAKKDKAGHFDVDPEFPDDVSERSYWMFKKSRS